MKAVAMVAELLSIMVGQPIENLALNLSTGVDDIFCPGFVLLEMSK